MQLPLQVTFRNIEASPALETRIRELAARLDRFSGHIMRCHVIIEIPHRHKHQGEHFEITIDLTVPGEEIAIKRTHSGQPSHEDAYVALRDAFHAARRKLEEYERERRGDIKHHVPMPHGRICEIDREAGSGRIETDDGRLIYFHRNSVLGRRFDDLETGIEVRFAEEAGDLGPQASTVHVLR